MGINISAAQFLLNEKRQGVRFGKTLTLGRQSVCMERLEYKKYLSKLGVTANNWIYADDLFKGLGAEPLDFMDMSNYEGATVIHDLNQPIKKKLHGAYDTIFDGGSLEHVFNFPTALKSLMEMLKPGGRLILITPFNNWAGHGFYQFSPELFYNCLSERNGFHVDRIYVDDECQWYSVADPSAAKNRVELISPRKHLLHISAQKDKVVPIFSSAPQQSDYTETWNAKETANPIADKGIKQFLISHMPFLEGLQARWRNRKANKQRSLHNRAFYKPVILELISNPFRWNAMTSTFQRRHRESRPRRQ